MGDEGSGWPERVTNQWGVVLNGPQCTGWMGGWERTLRCGNKVIKINHSVYIRVTKGSGMQFR